MSKYIIHTCGERLKYVQCIFLPSMYEQGIAVSDVRIWIDVNNEGCLQSFINSIDSLPEDGDTWHLQDDILICHDFKEKTEHEYDTELVCGFSSKYDKNVKPGKARGIDNIWYSFPCIRIPNRILKHFAIWFKSYIQKDNRYAGWIKSKKNDDLLFRYFLNVYYKTIEATNVAPNLIEHIDWLIGGSKVNNQRNEIIRSTYWDDEYLVQELEKKLNAF